MEKLIYMEPEDYHPFLLFHVQSNEAATKRFQNIKRDSMSIRRMLNGLEAQVVSVLTADGWDTRRRKRTA